jgi:O-6-methylguanine DNA methyltransferase
MTGKPDRTEARYDVFQTVLGWVAAVATERGIRRTSLPEPARDAALDSVAPALEGALFDPDSLRDVREQIARYCSGETQDLTVLPLDTHDASPFFSRAWEACRKVPAGETRTYAWLAAQAGNARAARGAGQAMARNPYPLLVPCHRIVGTDGSLHGFGGTVGLPMKQRLLEMERAGASVGQAATTAAISR